jgi:hypothetical protein
MRDSYIKEDRSRGIFFDQDWGAMPGVIPVASGGIHVWHMPALVNILSCVNLVNRIEFKLDFFPSFHCDCQFRTVLSC